MHFQLVSSHGMLAILEVLEGKCSRDVTMKLLQILNMVRVAVRCIHYILSTICKACCGRLRVLGEFLPDRWHSSHDGYVPAFNIYLIILIHLGRLHFQKVLL